MMEMGKLNVFYISSELKIGDITTNIASAFLTSATESEFQELLDGQASDENFNTGLFMAYVAKNGHYCTVLDKELLNPSG